MVGFIHLFYDADFRGTKKKGKKSRIYSSVEIPYSMYAFNDKEIVNFLDIPKA